MDRNKIIDWGLRIVAAAILLQTLPFKFTAHPSSVALFTELGVEPFGRIGLGVVELITAILLLVPGTVRYGIVLGIGLMVGALASHFFVIGINFMDDGGALFMLAVATMACLLILAYRHRSEVLGIVPGLKLA